MYKIEVTLEGIAPLLFNRFTEEAQEKMDKRIGGSTLTVEQKKQEALTKVYRNDQGLYIPGRMIKKCMINGAIKRGLKYGRKGLAPFLEALVFLEDQEVLLGKAEPDFIDETLGRRPPKTGSAVVIRRPGINSGWQASFILAVVDDRLDWTQIQDALAEGGLLAGLGDGRPEYGRFIVKRCEKTQ